MRLRERTASSGVPAEELERELHAAFRSYRHTLQHDRRYLLEQFRWIELARKVVGVGSVSTRCFILRARAGSPSPSPGSNEFETYSNGVRHVNVPDPDGNAIAFAEPADPAGASPRSGATRTSHR